MRTLLEKHNLKPITEVPIVQIGGMPEIAAALSNGAIAAAPMSYPMAYVAQQNGVKLLANMAQEGLAFGVHVMHGTPIRAQKRFGPGPVLVQKAARRCNADMNSKISDPGMLQGTIQYAYDFVEKIPLVKREPFKIPSTKSRQGAPRRSRQKPGQFYENGLVQELEQGFLQVVMG